MYCNPLFQFHPWIKIVKETKENPSIGFGSGIPHTPFLRRD